MIYIVNDEIICKYNYTSSKDSEFQIYNWTKFTYYEVILVQSVHSEATESSLVSLHTVMK